MIVSLSGTPGTGKTTVAKMIDRSDYVIIPMNELSRDYLGEYDEARATTEVEIDRLVQDIKDEVISIPQGTETHTIIEGHLSHHLPVVRIIVLRSSPKVLEERLSHRDYTGEKIRENMEAEALGVISIEAFETGLPVNEIDTTSLDPALVANEIQKIIELEREPLSGPEHMIDYSGEIMEWY
jgi:adenylate kinase